MADIPLALQFLSTLSLRRATESRRCPESSGRNFYPRSPCGERPRTLPALPLPIEDFYPRSPCGERHMACRTKPRYSDISIHALLAESDPKKSITVSKPRVFLSTLSLRRATFYRIVSRLYLTHFYPRSPCGERRAGRGCNYSAWNFYPRSPCGERPIHG